MTDISAAVGPASFSPKLKTYFFLSGVMALIVSVIGIILLPIWLFVGFWWANRAYAGLKLEVTDRNVIVKRGVFFRQELTIPLDKIQDISIREGPLLSALGLAGLRIETAGQRSAATGQSEADLFGLLDARGVRDRILLLRDHQSQAQQAQPKTAASPDVLTEIRDILLRIESRIGQQ